MKSVNAYARHQLCRKGHGTHYTHLIPRSRDDHKAWKLAQKKATVPAYRPRRRPRRNPLAEWERKLLGA